ncbi:MAG: tyrosine-type recombinase/integrase [Alphaproteobacteria bacterium]|nr:tyrosine-type recombinase/integrase [Alphaproteobacteria bacterium]
MKTRSRGRTPTTVKRTVKRGRRPNSHYRTREYLTEREVERLMKAAGRNRYGHRDATMILLALSAVGFRRMIERLGKTAKMPFSVHPHMLRHACGFKLANDGVDTRALQHYLGHKNIQHTVRYTELRSDRFNSFWKD